MELLLNRVAFTIAGFDVYWYGIIIAFAVALAFGLTFALLKVKGLPKDTPIDVFLAIVPLGIIFGRLFSVMFEDNTTILDFFEFRQGGMSIIGAVIGGAIGLVILCAIKKYNFLKLADMIVPVLILAQAIGRWGNYANQEVYGWVVTNPSWQFFPFAVNIDGTWHLALFFYEFVLNLIGFVILMVLYFKTKKVGICTGTYFIYYGTVRVVLESLRDNEYVLRLAGLPISQILSAVFIVAGIAILVYINVKDRQKNKKIEVTNEK